MFRKTRSVYGILFSLTVAWLSSSCNDTSGQASAPPPRPKQKQSKNLKLIAPVIPNALQEETYKIVHLGERLININKGKKEIGDSISSHFNNKQQLMQEAVYTETGKLKETTLYQYDAEGRLLSLQKKSYDGARPFEMNFSYNDEGQIVGTKTISSWESEAGTYAYDNLNYLLEAKCFDNRDSLWRTTTYSYDEKGNLILFVVKASTGDTVTINKYSYNRLNQCIQREHRGEPINCTGRDTWQISYNQIGDVAEEQSRGFRVRYSYQYDDKKNWAKQYVFYNNETEPNFLTTRIITYKR